MIVAGERKIVLVTRRTRLEELVARHHTVAQARFYLEHLGADFSDYEREQARYSAALHETLEVLEAHGRYQRLDRAFLPNFLFGPDDLVLALGQDGLVANTMKYLDGQPLVGLNPDPARYDGVLLPFEAADLVGVLPDLLKGRRSYRTVTMAKAALADKQVLYAVNDLFIGPKSHTSARYELLHGKDHEVQSSSGIIVSTGLGSTAWMRSVVTGSVSIAAALARPNAALARRQANPEYRPMSWDAERLRFAVREPFPSKTSQARIAFGEIPRGDALVLRSLMPENGVIFSDGIESDFLEFNSGAEATIGVAERSGKLVI
jgi:NAD kinase